MKVYWRLAIVATCCLAIGLPAYAGNIALTGHDDDFHQANDGIGTGGGPTGPAGMQLSALVSFARAGSALPVLTFDSGTELTSSLTDLGVVWTNVDPNNGALVTDALFNPAVYSAFIVASDETCGGCDNTAAGEANIAAHKTAIDDFLNGGGGIIGLAGADSTHYYDFVPEAASSVGGAPTDGYTATGLFGIPAVNGDPTHNLFWDPGTHGESTFYQVAEVNSSGNGTIPGPNAAATLVCDACTTTGGVITGAAPEPSSILLFGSGLIAFALFGLSRSLKRKSIEVA
jgi:hypothetical protein